MTRRTARARWAGCPGATPTRRGSSHDGRAVAPCPGLPPFRLGGVEAGAGWPVRAAGVAGPGWGRRRGAACGHGHGHEHGRRVGEAVRGGTCGGPLVVALRGPPITLPRFWRCGGSAAAAACLPLVRHCRWSATAAGLSLPQVCRCHARAAAAPATRSAPARGSSPQPSPAAPARWPPHRSAAAPSLPPQRTPVEHPASVRHPRSTIFDTGSTPSLTLVMHRCKLRKAFSSDEAGGR
ncbi:hypothetical protein SAMN04488000_110190 [Lentzea albida]|uniref:Uncharacterized protein n=1 Tax=Lentzea albida TaxID=65499 RepID=A0A1H9QP73_9PSEU|nr:hypothetical protein SAMN04488000_110190 [Lentzea albida]